MALRLGPQNANVASWEPFMGKMPMLLKMHRSAAANKVCGLDDATLGVEARHLAASV
jgi:hypothetical protein